MGGGCSNIQLSLYLYSASINTAIEDICRMCMPVKGLVNSVCVRLCVFIHGGELRVCAQRGGVSVLWR